MLVCSRCSKAGCIILSYGLRMSFRGIFDETKYERTLVRVNVTAAMGTLHKTGGWNIPIIFVLIPVYIFGWYSDVTYYLLYKGESQCFH